MKIIFLFLALISLATISTSYGDLCCAQDDISHDHSQKKAESGHDHCHHTCQQCHQLFLISTIPQPRNFLIVSLLKIFHPSSDLKDFSENLYRPPISLS